MNGPTDRWRRPDPLARRAAATPDRTAVVDATDGSAVRYNELDREVGLVTGRLAGLGLEAGDHLGMLTGTSVAAVRLIHAGWRLGLRLVPMNVRLEPPELDDLAGRSDLDAFLCTDAHADVARTVVDCPVASIEDGGTESAVRPLAAVERTTPDAHRWCDDEPALAMFTSGTSGSPKAVTMTMGNLVASATSSAFRLGVHPDDRWLLCLPIYHMGGLAPVVRTALYGTTLVVREGFDASAVARETGDHDVTGLSLVPTQLRRILDSAEPFADTVRTVLVGGAPTPEPLIDRCRMAGVPIHPTYGLTEAASQVATATPAEAFEHPETVGQPLFDTDVTIVDEDREPLGHGVLGEIVVAGPTVTPGYYGDPGATDESFCEHGLLTGDLGRVDESGRLWVSGRRSDRIVTGGENVAPEEVAAVIREHDGVAEVAVVGLPDAEWGERVAALVVLDDPGLDAESIHARCRDRLAGFKVPDQVRFVDALPRTPSGTVDRAAVRDQFLDGPA